MQGIKRYVSLHQGFISNTKLFTMDIDRRDHPPIVQKPYTLP